VSLLELGREPEAERELRCALELAPQLLEARFKLAGIAHRQGDRAAALEGYEACCAARPDWFEAWLNRGMVLFELERAGEAAQAYRRTTELRPASVEAWTGYGRSLTASNGRADDLIVAALRVVELLPESADAWHRLAVAYRYGEFYPSLPRRAIAPWH
jgi:cytochrome c-type biogenesis protein CcmH/NrfG